MPGARSPHQSRFGPATRERLRSGPIPAPRLLIAMLLGLFMLAGTVILPTSAFAASTLTPCSTAPTGPIVTLDGEMTLDRTAAGRKMLRRAGVKTQLIRPANSLTGWPTFPVKKVRFGATSRVWLKGGLRFTRKHRRVAARNLVVIVPGNVKRPANLTAVVSGRRLVLLRLKGGLRKIRRQRGEIDLSGARGRLTASAVKRINRGLGLGRAPRSKRLRPGVQLHRFDLNATYFVSVPDVPKGETPVEPPVAVQPSAAVAVEAAPTGEFSIKWELRDSWIDYINTGIEPVVGDGASKDSPRAPKNLVYSFNFPFKSGWTVPGSTPDSTLVKGSGSLAFRFCEHTVNFKVSDPEIELAGADNSRMIFRVDGTDGTAFPDLRAVMVKLVPNPATQMVTTTTGGVTTVTWTKIPGYIPAEGTGIFAGFYPAWDPANGAPGSGYTEANRPDRFGFLSLTYTIPATP